MTKIDETYDEIAVKTISKCLAHMKSPEFARRDHGLLMRYGNSLSLLSLASLYTGGIPYSV